MTRPKHPHQCIGINAESNVRMRKAWNHKPVYGQVVFILRAGKTEVEQWNFCWFTIAGARLFVKRDGRFYDTLINWDRGDMLFVDPKEADVEIALRALSNRTKAELEVKKWDEVLNSVLVRLNDKA